MHSLFEEQIIQEGLKLHEDLMRGTDQFYEALSYLPTFGQYSVGPQVYIESLRKVKQAVKIPVFGSLNGFSSGGWIEYAKRIEDAGADGLELNIYYLPTDVELNSQEAEERYI